MEIRLQNPKLPGLDTSNYSKLSWRVQASRKVYHVKWDQRFAVDIKRLAQIAKEANFVTKMWGKHAHVSEVVDKSSTPSKIKRLIKVSQQHINYQCSMLLENVQGIINLYVLVEIHQEGTNNCLGRTSLCQAMLMFIRLSDGHQLVTEVHQASTLVGLVHIVNPNTPEAERMAIMMNKNLPAYIGHVLRDQGLSDSFLFELVKQSCCPVMVSEINQCTWDSETRTLVTKREAESSKNEEELEKTSCFKDAFAGLGIAVNGGATKKHALPPEVLFDLDRERSIKAIQQLKEAQPSNAGTTPLKKGNNKELIDISSKEESDKKSTPSLGRQGMLRAAAAIGEEESPASSDEDDGQAPGAANGG
jgi:hypothetical protein